MAKLTHEDGSGKVHVRGMSPIAVARADSCVKGIHHVHVDLHLVFHLRACSDQGLKRQQQWRHHPNVGTAIALTERYELAREQSRVACIDEVLIEILRHRQ